MLLLLLSIEAARAKTTSHRYEYLRRYIQDKDKIPVDMILVRRELVVP